MRYPTLRTRVRERLTAFAASDAARAKNAEPNLGEMLPLLALVDTPRWVGRERFGEALFGEYLSRGVLWACTKDPALVRVQRGDASRLQRTFDASAVGLRLLAFHVGFAELAIDASSGGSIGGGVAAAAARADVFLGRPPRHVASALRERVAATLACDSWDAWFSLAGGLRRPSPAELLTTLEDAVATSRQRGYHSDTTDFTRVQASGVSSILLKGESYSVAPNLKELAMRERWRFPPSGNVSFLDASCLVVSFDGQTLAHVDYAQREYRPPGFGEHVSGGTRDNVRGLPTRPPAITHSGDVVDGATGVGEHTIKVRLSGLPSSVHALAFTVTAYTTSLAEMLAHGAPSVHLSAPTAADGGGTTETELCTYALEDHVRGDSADTAVLMCILRRESVAARWEMRAVGALGQGRAHQYEPIERAIAKWVKENPSGRAVGTSGL